MFTRRNVLVSFGGVLLWPLLPALARATPSHGPIEVCGITFTHWVLIILLEDGNHWAVNREQGLWCLDHCEEQFIQWTTSRLWNPRRGLFRWGFVSASDAAFFRQAWKELELQPPVGEGC